MKLEIQAFINDSSSSRMPKLTREVSLLTNLNKKQITYIIEDADSFIIGDPIPEDRDISQESTAKSKKM